MAWLRIGSGALSLCLMASGCAQTQAAPTYPHTKRADACGRAWPCMADTVATSELSRAQRIALARSVDARVEDRTLIGVAYDGQRLRLLPECMIEGRYVRRELKLEQRFDPDEALFVVADPDDPNGFLTATEPTGAGADLRMTARIARSGVAGHPDLDDPACDGLTHVIEDMIVGVEGELGESSEALPIALVLGTLPKPASRHAKRERKKVDERVVIGTIVGLVLIGSLVTLCVVTDSDCDF